jgi:hypothetical protein
MINTTWAYDFTSDRWSRRSGWARPPRSGAISFTVKGRSFVGTGGNGNSTYDDFDEFQPAQAFDSNDF